MNKLFLIAGFSLMSMTAFAQNNEVENEDIEVMEVKDIFSEIALTELPNDVSKALKSGYPNGTLTKAFSNQEATKYKIHIATKDGEELHLFLNPKGVWLEM